jgi:hypothetical protein
MTRHIKLILVIMVLFLVACSTENPTEIPTSDENITPLVTDEISPPTETPLIETNTPTSIPQSSDKTSDTATATIAPTPTQAIKVSGPEEYPLGYNPLTGLPVDELSLLERRPIGVKVQLYPRGGRPPWGVSLADIVYDYYQNDGLTRLHAIFYSKDAEQVGPIRSARLFDEQIMRMYKSIFAFGGADWRVFNRIYDADLRDYMVVEGAHNCPPMCRIDPNGANYLVTNTEELSQSISDKGIDNGPQDLHGMSFNVKIPAAGDPGEQVEVHWSYSAYIRWKYDQESGKYLREQDTSETSTREGEKFAPLTDRLTGDQISADNVVVIPLTHTDLYPQNNFEIIDIQLPGGESGVAYAFRDGKAYELTWVRPELDSVLTLKFADGSDFPFKPGNTWFEIVGKSTVVNRLEDNTWRFEFRF